MQSMIIYKGKVKTKSSERTNEPSRRHESATCELATTSLHGGIFSASNNRFPKQSVFCCNNLGCKKKNNQQQRHQPTIVAYIFIWLWPQVHKWTLVTSDDLLPKR